MYSHNITKNYIFIFLMNFNLTSVIWMIYLASKGINLTQLGILEGIFHITSFLMEVPTGTIADLFGRKVSRTLGRIFFVFSNIIILFSNNFYLILFGFIVSAISYNLESGAGEALIYDSLKEINKEKNYSKIAGIIEIVTQIGMTLGYFLGGYLSQNSYKLAYIVSIIIGIISVLQSLSFKESDVSIEENYSILFQAKESLNIIIKNKKIIMLILTMEGIMTFTTCIFFYLQNYFLENGLNQFKIGTLMSISSIFSALCASLTYKIEKKFSENTLIQYVPIIIVLTIWGIALSKYSFIYFIIMSGLEGILYIIYSNTLNKLIPSNKRATILSFSSMIFSLYMIIIFPIFGKIADLYTLKNSFIFLAVLATILETINVFFISRNRVPM